MKSILQAIIVCPSSLVKNWDKEIHKWLGDRVHGLPVDTSTGGKDEITSTLSTLSFFLTFQTGVSMMGSNHGENIKMGKIGTWN